MYDLYKQTILGFHDEATYVASSTDALTSTAPGSADEVTI